MSYYMQELDISSVATKLHQLSNEELKQLLNDESYQQLDDMTKDLPQVKTLEMERDLLIETNKTSAQKNLSREPTYRQKRQTLIDGHNELKQLKEDIDKKKSRLLEVSRQTSLDTRLALMQTSTAEAEEQSEEIADQFLGSRLDFESFIKDFIESRKLSHLRRIKTDKMMECLRNQTNNMSNNSVNQFAPIRPAPPPPPSLPFASTGANPYPPYPLYAPQSMPVPPQPQQPLQYSYNPFR